MKRQCDNCEVESDDDNEDGICPSCNFEPYDPAFFDECGGLRLDLIKPKRETK
jgi:hypothetical protein